MAILPPISPQYRSIVIKNRNGELSLRTADGVLISKDPEVVSTFAEFAWWRERRRISRVVPFGKSGRDAQAKEHSEAAENAQKWLHISDDFRSVGKCSRE